MAEILKIGMVGMSEGNGHPYSWSAIFNGYNKKVMKTCPFPGIPEYLEKQVFPADGLGEVGKVTHIWTQDLELSKHIAQSSNIENVVVNLEEMIGKVDAVLLARDDAKNHYEMALPFLEAGLPIFIDKPLALSEKAVAKFFSAQKYEDQIFTCSTMRYAEELMLSAEEKKEIGKIVHVEASVPKHWKTYAVHLIEPIVAHNPERGQLLNVFPFIKNGIHMAIIEWEKMSAYIKVTGTIPTPVKFEYFGEKANIVKNFSDAFSCFKGALKTFVEVINKENPNIEKGETLEIIKILEQGKI